MSTAENYAPGSFVCDAWLRRFGHPARKAGKNGWRRNAASRIVQLVVSSMATREQGDALFWTLKPLLDCQMTRS